VLLVPSSTYCMGGTDLTQNWATMEMLDTAGAGGWTDGPSMNTPRGFAAIKEKLFVAGGLAFPPTSTFASVEMLDTSVAGGKWSYGMAPRSLSRNV
jgi:hypothetical protein